VRQNVFACPRCGFETGFAPLTITARGGADACPMCDRALPAAATADILNNSLRRMEHENPTLLDYLIERMNRKEARQRTVRWAALFTASVLTALIAYQLRSPLF
jgi:hypothetical protein